MKLEILGVPQRKRFGTILVPVIPAFGRLSRRIATLSKACFNYRVSSKPVGNSVRHCQKKYNEG